MNETELDQLAPTLFADVKPAASLRARVLAAAPQPPKTSPLRWGLAGGGLVAAGIVATSFLLRPKPAYADIERAMAAVQTAQWQVEWESNGQQGQVTQCVASQVLPAIATRTVRGDRRDVSLVTPTANWTYDSGRDLYLKDKPSTAAAIRQQIQSNFFPPVSLAPGNYVYKWTPWKVTETTLEGKPALRYQQTCKHKQEYYVTTLWADPKTRRLLRQENESRWPGSVTRSVSSHFRYDQPLPADAFQLAVAKGKRVFINDHHFYPGAHAVTPTQAERVALYKVLHQLDSGWASRRMEVFGKAFDFGYLPTLYNGIIAPSPQKRAAQQEAYWRNRMTKAAKVHPRWKKWQSRLVSVEELPSVRIDNFMPFCLPEGDPPIWKVLVAVECEATEGKYPVYNGTTGYTLWVRRQGDTFRVVYAELRESFGDEPETGVALFAPGEGW